jgi:hypothetical protein
MIKNESNYKPEYVANRNRKSTDQGRKFTEGFYYETRFGESIGNR